MPTKDVGEAEKELLAKIFANWLIKTFVKFTLLAWILIIVWNNTIPMLTHATPIGWLDAWGLMVVAGLLTF